MLFLMLLEIVGIIISFIILASTSSPVGLIICGICLVLMIFNKVLLWFVENHPLILEGICLALTLICSAISVLFNTFWPTVICCVSIGFLKGLFIVLDADTSWYDLHFFTIDGKVYYAFNGDNNSLICLCGIALFIGFYLLLALPYALSELKFLSFVPGVFFLIRLVRGIVALIQEP